MVSDSGDSFTNVVYQMAYWESRSEERTGHKLSASLPHQFVNYRSRSINVPEIYQYTTPHSSINVSPWY